MGDPEQKSSGRPGQKRDEWAPEPPRAEIRQKASFLRIKGYCCWCYTVKLEEGPSPGSEVPPGTYGLNFDPGVPIVDPKSIDQTGLSAKARNCLKYEKGQLKNGRVVVWKSIGKEEAELGSWTFCFLSTCEGSSEGKIGLSFRNPDGHTAKVSTPVVLGGPKPAE